MTFDADKLRALADALGIVPDDTPDVAYFGIDMTHGQARALRPAILAMAEENKRLREALGEIERCGTFQPHRDDPPAYDHYADIARRALGKEQS